MTQRFIARQFSHPRGLLGRLSMWLMNRRNVNLNAFAVQQLGITPADRVLEVGFGGGLALPNLVEHVAFTAGVDRAGDAVRKAEARFATSIAIGKAEFRQGSVEALPYEAGSFTKVFTVNTIYFWKSLDSGFNEIGRVLTPAGRVVVGFYPSAAMEPMKNLPDICTLREPEEVIDALTRAGFENVQMEVPSSTTAWKVVVGTHGSSSTPATMF